MGTGFTPAPTPVSPHSGNFHAFDPADPDDNYIDVDPTGPNVAVYVTNDGVAFEQDAFLRCRAAASDLYLQFDAVTAVILEALATGGSISLTRTPESTVHFIARRTLLYTDADDVRLSSPDVIIGTGAGTIGVFGSAGLGKSAAIANAAGGVVVDIEARAALNTLLARMRTWGWVTA